MKDLSQFITIALTVLFFGYMFYNYEPIEKDDSKRDREKDRDTIQS